MAEYIEEQEILWRMNNALDEQDTYLPIHFKEMVIDECNTSDVVERSEIDKAIEEMEKEIKENHLNVIEYADAEWILKDFVYGAIDRLKRNIGEQIL